MNHFSRFRFLAVWLVVFGFCHTGNLHAATFNISGTTLQLALGTGETCAITAGAANDTFALTGGTWTGTNSADATGNGTASLSAVKAGFTAVTVDDTGTGDAVTFNTSGANPYASSFTVTLDDAAAGAITFNGTTTFTGSAAFSASTSKNIVVSSGAVVSVVNGGLTLSANQQGTPTAGSFRGIDVNGGTVTTSGNGAVVLSGKGGDSSSGNHGINLRTGGTVTSTASGAGAGTITLTGIGRGTASNSGIEVAGTGSSVTSVSGNILITGSSFGTVDGNTGFYLNTAATVTSTGTGATAANITINATAGSGTTNNAGFTLFGLSTTNGISAVDGDITITGQGRGQGTLTDGIRVQDRSFIRTTGDGNIALTGTASTDGGAGSGIWVTNSGGSGAFVEALGTGTVTMTGTGTGTGVNADIYLNGSTVGNASSAAAITLNANTLTVDATSNLLGSAAGSITIQPRTAGRDILLGADDTATALGLTAAEVARINVGNVTIGSLSTGILGVSTNVTFPATTTVNLIAAAINLNGNTVSAGTVNQSITGLPVIRIEQPAATPLPNGTTKGFGSVAVGSSADLVFTVKNSGSGDLTGLGITIDGASAAEFSVFASPVVPVVPGGSTTFTIRCAATSFGSKTAALHLASNAVGNPSYDINLTAFTPSTSPLSGTKAVGPTGLYTSLTQAITEIQGVGLSGPLLLELQTTYVSSVETFPLAFSNLGTTATNNVTVRPQTGATALNITSANTTATVDLNGAQFVTFDGRAGGAGTAKQLTIANTSTSGRAVQFINEASSNALRFLTVQGVNTSASSGTVVFSTTTGANGNDNNTIDTCDLRDGATTPRNGIYSLGSTGTTAQANSGNTVSNCNVFNFVAATAVDAAGVRLEGGNDSWTISGNSFYQTATRAAVAANVRAISINNASGNNFTVTGNFIGGDSPSAAVTTQKWTTTGTLAYLFQGIRLNVGTTTPSSVQGNTIQNIVWTTSNNATTLPGIWSGIYVQAGSANIGTVTGNTIGTGTGTGSISVTTSGSAGTTFGIGSAGSGTVAIANNTIGSITTNGSSIGFSASLTGIQVIAGTNNISNNLVGSAGIPSPLTANLSSLNAATSSTSTTIAQQVTGILSSSSTSTSITGNTVANLNNNYYGGTVAAGQIRGIVTSAGVNTITGNTVRNLSTTTLNEGTTTSASVLGIIQTSTVAGQTVSQNVVHSLANTATVASVVVTGIYYAGSTTTGPNTIARNLVHSLAIASTSTSSFMQGMTFNAGTFTAQNNIVRVGLNAGGASTAGAATVRGFLDSGTTAGRNFYHNTVSVGGTQTSGAVSTFAFSSAGASNTRDFRNNVFVNARTNSGATSKHYAVVYGGTTANPAGLTSNNNLLLASGTGGVLGSYNSADVTTLAAWQAATGQDVTSAVADPLFVNPTGTAANLDLHLSANSPAENAGVFLATVTDDIDGGLRSVTTPDIGADEFGVIPNLPPTFSGYTVSTKKNTATSIGHAKLLARAADPDGGTLALSGVSPASAQGGTVTTSSGQVTYTPPLNYTGPDTFTVTFTDGQGGSTPGTVNVTITADSGSGSAGGNQATLTLLPDNAGVAVLFYGIPGQSYQFQRSPDLQTWTTLQTTTASADGSLLFIDPNPPTGSAFYRTAIP